MERTFLASNTISAEPFIMLNTTAGMVRAYSRASFDSYLPDLIEEAQQQHDEFALMMLEIDHFKSINDAFGHLRGDTAIREFAERVQEAIRPQDLLFRYGGDEFVLIFPQTHLLAAQPIAQRTLEHINRRPFSGDPPLTISVSAGMAMFPADADTAESLFACADRRCRRAKQVARGQLITDDSPAPGDDFLLQEPSRLLERDQELEQLHRFLEGIPQNSQNILRIAGKVGSGKRRFMAAARAAARLHGYATLDLYGRPGLHTRIFGALAEARLGWREVLAPELGVAAFINGLRHIVTVADHRGMVITVENLSGVDRASLEFLRELLLHEGMKNLALIYVDGDVATGDILWANMQPTLHIELPPLSLHGLRVWVRHTLHWEAPDDLIAWLFRQTSGFPAQVEQVLKRLVEGYQLQRRGKRWTYPAELTSTELPPEMVAAPAIPPSHLPKQAANFVGRENQIRALQKLLPHKPLIAIVGPGGVGKTRLALQVASEASNLFPDGSFFIPLAALATIDDLLIALVAALRVPLQGREDPKTQLLAYLHNKRALLLFDHLAHRHNGEELLGDLLNAAPNLTLLVTTRDHLNLPDQTLIEVNGLSYPVTATDLEIERYDAVQLFLRSIHPPELAANLDRETKEQVAQICQLVDGVPLALELAASFTQEMPIAKIANGLEKSLVSFVTEQAMQHRNFVLHYHSLVTVFASLQQSLSEIEQEILGRLALFSGSFTGHAAHAITGASPFFLSALIAHSYLQRTTDQRYTMHELLRQYCLKWLSAATLVDAQTRHCQYYAVYVAAAEARMATQSLARSEFNQEVDNVRLAWQWAIEHKLPLAIQQICSGLANFYRLAGQYQEARAVLATGLSKLAEFSAGTEQPYRELWLRLMADLDRGKDA